MRKKNSQGAALASSLMLAPWVIWMRAPTLMAEASGTTGGLGVETTRAVTEKAAAVAQGIAAAQMSAIGAAMSFWPDVLSGRTPSIVSGVAAERIAHAALAPMGKTVRSNYRRLSRKAP